MINSKRKIYFSGFIFTILILVFIICLILPLFLTIKKDSIEFVSQKEKLSGLEKKRGSLKNIEEDYFNIKPSLEKINSIFISSREPIDFISFLEKTAEELNLSIQISPTGEELKKETWPSLSFQMKISGAFPDFIKFLNKLESSLYLIEVENLNIKKITENQVKIGTKKVIEINYIQAILDIKVFTKTSI